MLAHKLVLLLLVVNKLSLVVSDPSCYDIDGAISGLAHTCVCNENTCNEDGCVDGGGIWTDGCRNCHCDGAVGNAVGEGCFFSEPHTCNCDANLCEPSACEAGGGAWTNVCSSCTCAGSTGEGGTSGGSSACFSKWTTVEVLRDDGNGATVTTMQDLRVGDHVKTATGKYEAVYAFGHFHEKRSAEFLQIQTASVLYDSLSSPSTIGLIEITRDHLIFVNGKKRPVKAGSVTVGDVLLLHSTSSNHTSSGNSNHVPAVVTDISMVEREGIYAPLTPDGTIVVNGIVASTYAAISSKSTSENVEIAGLSFFNLNQADAIHVTLSPLRIICTTTSLFQAVCNDLDEETNMQKYVAWGIGMVHWGEEQNIFVQMTLSVLALFLGTSIWAFEAMFSLQFFFLALLVAATTTRFFHGYSPMPVKN